jgi:hypothetical protein
MILNHDLITTANPLRELVKRLGELGHHVESANDAGVEAWRRDLEYPALVRFAWKMAQQYADDAHNQHRYLAMAGLDHEAHGLTHPTDEPEWPAPDGIPQEVECYRCPGTADYIGQGDEDQPLYTCRRCRISFTTAGEPA